MLTTLCPLTLPIPWSSTAEALENLQEVMAMIALLIDKTLGEGGEELGEFVMHAYYKDLTFGA